MTAGWLSRYALPSLLAVLLLPATAAQAGGPPPTSLDAGPEGVLETGGEHRFTAIPLASKTVLTRSRTQGGRVLRASVLEGLWGVPVVANDGASGGLSADGGTLVLTRVAEGYPRRHSSFAIVDTEPMALRRTVELDGEWRFHALSPRGRRLYLIEQLEPLDPTRQAVRVYDLATDRLLEAAEPMRGLPITRATGTDGHWEYTLYAGGERPFIHALDTVRRTSLSLDLPHRVARHRRLWALRLAIRKGRVAVVHGDQIVASAARLHGAPRPAEARHGSRSRWH